MKDGQFYYIQGWMGKRIGLRGNDLICFAVIYGFSMDGESQFKGNLDYLAGCMFATQPTALLSLKKLLDCNLILKQDDVVNGKKRCYYSTNIIYDAGDFFVIDTTKEPLVVTTKEPLVVTTKEPLPKNNNIYNYKKDIKKEIIKESDCDQSQGETSKKKRFVKPTIEQIEAYIAEKKYNFDAEYFFDFYESKGWMVGKNHMTDWKAACRTWGSMRKQENNEKEEEKEEEIAGWDDVLKRWLKKNVPNIADMITMDIFRYFREESFCDRYTLADRLKEMNEAYDGGDIVELFKKMYL